MKLEELLSFIQALLKIILLMLFTLTEVKLIIAQFKKIKPEPAPKDPMYGRKK